MRPRTIAVLLAVASLAVAASPASAAEITAQCDETDSGSYLQEVLDDSLDGDVVTLEEGSQCHVQDLFDATDRDEFELRQNTQITLQGNGTGLPEVLDGDDDFRILRGTGVGTTVIRNLTFQNGNYGGSGAAIKIQGDSAPTLSNLKIVGNDSGNGFGDRAPVTMDTNGDGGTVTVEDSSFEGGSASRGGGLLINSSHEIVLDHNTFSGNTADRQGGGAVLELDSETLVLDSETRGGPGAPVTVVDNTFSGNRVVMPPQGIPHLVGGGLAILNIADDLRSVTQSGNTFSDNTIVPSFFLNNNVEQARQTREGGLSAYFAGGGEYTEASVLSTNDRYVKNSIEAPTQTDGAAQDGNFAFEFHGGGLAVSGRELELEGRNLVAAGNTIPEGQGGGVSSDRGVQNGFINRGSEIINSNTLRLLDSTLDANQAGNGTGSAIYGNYDDHLVVHNGIVFGNTSERGRQIDGFDDGGTKDIRFTDYCAEDEQQVPKGGGLAPAEGEGNICADPQLVDPPNGDVHQNKDSSPTLDVGSNDLVPSGLTTDWERPPTSPDARIADSVGSDGARVDMGADEVVQPPPPPPTPAPAAPAPAPQPQGAVLGVQKQSCISRRAFRIRLRVPRGKRAISATVRVNGKRVQVIRGRRLRAPVVLRGLPKGRVSVRITIRLRGGKRVTGTRIYNTCIPRLPGDGPPPV